MPDTGDQKLTDFIVANKVTTLDTGDLFYVVQTAGDTGVSGATDVATLRDDNAWVAALPQLTTLDTGDRIKVLETDTGNHARTVDIATLRNDNAWVAALGELTDLDTGDRIKVLETDTGNRAKTVNIATMRNYVGSGIRTLRSFGAVNDSGATDQTAIINTAFAAGVPLTGEHLKYGYKGTLNLPEGANCADVTFKQLGANDTGFRITLQGYNVNNLKLVRVKVDRNGNGYNDGLVSASDPNGYLNNAFGIYIYGGTGHHLEDLEVYGNDGGTGISLWYLDETTKFVRPYVHDMQFIRANPTVTVDDNINGIQTTYCDRLVISEPKIHDLTSQVINPSDGSITAPGTTLSVSSGAFVAADVGRLITIAGAGVAAADLTTTIASVTDGTTVELTDAASTTVSGAVVTFTFVASNRHTRGIATGYTTDIVVSKPMIYKVGQGVDLTGSGGNLRGRVLGGTAVDCYSNGFKLANTAVDCLVADCVAIRCGFHSFLCSGPAGSGFTHLPQRNTFRNCTAIDNGYGGNFATRLVSPLDVCAFRNEKNDYDTTYPRATRFIDCTEQSTNLNNYAISNNVPYTAGYPVEVTNLKTTGSSFVTSRASGMHIPYAKLSRVSSGQTITTGGSPKVVSWNNDIEDPSGDVSPGTGLHSTSSDTDTIFIPIPGIWHLRANIFWGAGNAATLRRVYFYNGASQIDTESYNQVYSPDTNAFFHEFTYDGEFTTGDAIKVYVFHENGSDIDVQVLSSFSATLLVRT